MEFKKYVSLENTYRQATINKIIDSGLSGDLWQVTEKIHGANFSFWYNGYDDIRVASRTQFVDGTFFNCQSVINKHMDAVIVMFNLLNLTIGDTLTVYGELYGANVQKEVYYGEGKDFTAFDIKVNGLYQNTTEVERLCKDAGLPHAPVLDVLSFEKAL